MMPSDFKGFSSLFQTHACTVQITILRNIQMKKANDFFLLFEEPLFSVILGFILVFSKSSGEPFVLLKFCNYLAERN